MSKKAVVVESFVGEIGEELTLEKGTNVLVLKVDEDGWWTVEANGKKGIFPGSYLEYLPDSPPKEQAKPKPTVAATTTTASSPGNPRPTPTAGRAAPKVGTPSTATTPGSPSQTRALPQPKVAGSGVASPGAGTRPLPQTKTVTATPTATATATATTTSDTPKPTVSPSTPIKSTSPATGSASTTTAASGATKPVPPKPVVTASGPNSLSSTGSTDESPVIVSESVGKQRTIINLGGSTTNVKQASPKPALQRPASVYTPATTLNEAETNETPTKPAGRATAQPRPTSSYSPSPSKRPGSAILSTSQTDSTTPVTPASPVVVAVKSQEPESTTNSSSIEGGEIVNNEAIPVAPIPPKPKPALPPKPTLPPKPKLQTPTSNNSTPTSVSPEPESVSPVPVEVKPKIQVEMKSVASQLEENSEATITADSLAIEDDEKAVVALTADEKREKYRRDVINEVITTENDYVKDLDIIIRLFYLPLRETKIISEGDLQKLFSNVETIYGVNLELQKALNNQPADTPLMVGLVFLKMVPFLKVYTTYCTNQPIALAALEKCKSSSFDAFLETCIKNPECRGLTLFSFLIKPIQRICKYPLLLRDLLKNTAPDHPDFANIQNALEKIEEVVAYVNERKRLAENLQRIMDIQNSIEADEDISLIEPSRRFIQEGQIQLIIKGKPHERKYYLFNDLVMFTRPKKSGSGTKDCFVAKFLLAEVRLVDITDTDVAKDAVELSHKTLNEKIIVSFASGDEKSEWLKGIKQLVKEFQKKEFLSKKLEADKKAEEPLSTSSSAIVEPPPPPPAPVPSSSSASSRLSTVFGKKKEKEKEKEKERSDSRSSFVADPDFSKKLNKIVGK